MIRYWTYEDAIQHLLDFLGGGSGDVVLRDCRRAVWQAYLDLASAHPWSYLWRHGRVNTSAPVSDATYAYSAAARVFTLTPGASGLTVPSWANLGYLRVGVVNYRLVQPLSATTALADDEVCPPADLPAGTAGVLYQDSYPLPDDFIAQDQATYEMNFGGLNYTHPRDWLYENRYTYAQGVPTAFTVMGDPRIPGRLTMRLYPYPVEGKSIDFLYRRRPRPIAVYQATGGVATATAGSTAVATTGTAFTPQMVGSVLRLSATPALPTGVTGKNPAAFESAVVAYSDPAHVAVYDPAPFALSGVGYTVSDPADLELGAMLTAFQRGCEAQLSIARNLKDRDAAVGRYSEALRDAKAADSRNFQARHEGATGRFRQRFRDMPRGPDQS